MTKVYIAAAYGRREEMAQIAQPLVDAGHEITSRWLAGHHDKAPDGVELDSDAHWRWCAEDDIADLRAAEVCVSVLGGGNRSRGGRHVEFGLAFALGKRLIILGVPSRENVFHTLPGVEHYQSIAEVIEALQPRPRVWNGYSGPREIVY